jgi:exo-1,4-beta-D-glucosaminidase
MLPADHQWPIDDVWNYHAGGGQFKTLQIFTDALTARYGKPTGIEDYANKSQLMTYEGERAMFEAFARNKYRATGVIQWMLNNAWPSMIWHLYDYFLRPAGGYFGAKKACEPMHVQYSYDDRSIVVVNGTDRAVDGKVVVRVVNLDSSERFAREVPVHLGPDATGRVLSMPDIDGLSPTHFLDLRLLAPSGRVISSNLYWLSTSGEELDWEKSNWYTTPVKKYADFTALGQLPPAHVMMSVGAMTTRTGRSELEVTLRNTGRTLAFFMRLQLTKARHEEVLPVLWQDNYISLMPGEKRVVTVTWNPRDADHTVPNVVLSGSNVMRQVVPR